MTPVVRGVEMMIGRPKNGAPANDNPVACCVRVASELKIRGWSLGSTLRRYRGFKCKLGPRPLRRFA